MPEFEEIKPNPDLHKDSHQYQPGNSKTAQESGQESTSSTPSSNMRGRWKRPTRSNASKTIAKDDTTTSRPSPAKEPVRQEREERSFSPNEDYEIEDYENEENDDEQETEYEQNEDQDPRPIRETRKHHHTEPRHSREEYAPRAQASRKTTENKPFKPTSRKDVFIPKTKQDSERFRRNPSMAKKTSLWSKILAFFGLGTVKKRSSTHRSHSDSSRGPRSGSQNRRPYQQRRHPGQQQRHRSGPPHKNDQKSND